MIEFEGWPKIPRLKKGMVVTEKIDGTNAAVVIEKHFGPSRWETGERVGTPIPGRGEASRAIAVVQPDGSHFMVGAQSRNRLITPESDNAGFARYVFENAATLVDILGDGRHFGEWWGSGIQRGYGLTNGEKRFSLFNVRRYAGPLAGGECAGEVPPSQIGLGLVPELYAGDFSIEKVDEILEDLTLHGSKAARGYMNPEGVVIYHAGAGTTWKAFCDPAVEAAPKSLGAEILNRNASPAGSDRFA